MPHANVQSAWAGGKLAFLATQYFAIVVGMTCEHGNYDPSADEMFRGWEYAVTPLVEYADGTEAEEFFIVEAQILGQVDIGGEQPNDQPTS